MLLLLLACNSGDGSDSLPTDDTADDTGAASVDTAEGRFLWTALSPTPSWTADVSGFGTGLGWIDVDQDGDDDLIVAYGNDMSPGPLRLYLNLDGALDPEPAWRSEDDHYYGHLSVGDVNGDGWPDVAVSRFLGDGRFGDLGGVEVFLNDAGALQERPAWESAEAFYSFSCALGDVDNDGDLDLAAASGEAYQGDPDYTRVFLNDGQGGFGEAAAWTEDRPRHGFDVAWADFNEDGWLDLVVANNGSAHALYLNEGGALAASPAWEAEGEPERFEGNSLDWGDVDGDGWLDLVVSDNNQLGGAGTVSLYCGPTLERCWESADPPAYQSAVSLEDFDGDGLPELFAGAWWGPVRRYDNVGGQLSAEPDWESATNNVIEAFAWSDVDRSHLMGASWTGYDLQRVPGRARVLSVQGGVAGDGYISGPGVWVAEVLQPAPRDLAVSNWDREVGDHVFERAPQ